MKRQTVCQSLLATYPNLFMQSSGQILIPFNPGNQNFAEEKS